MKRCIIITSFIDGYSNEAARTDETGNTIGSSATGGGDGVIRKITSIEPDDYIICADGGFDYVCRENIRPDIVMGDFDSIACPAEKIPEGIKIVTVPAMKDITDTALCLEHALEQGFTQITIVGGLGGRLDHTLANIQNLAQYTKKGAAVTIADLNNSVIFLCDSSIRIPRRESFKISLISHSNICRGVTISGVEYPLNKHTLYNDFPLGVSNEFASPEAFVEVQSGELLVILAR